jgi:uncharacterized protein
VRPALRALELSLLFLGVPLALRLGHLHLPKILVLLVFTAGCFAALWWDGTFQRRELGSARQVRRDAPGIALRALAAAGVVAGVVLLRGQLLFELPRHRPLVWALVLCLYPFLSAWPQELVYRTFFFHRYGRLLGRRGTVLASAVAFSVLHLVFRDRIAPLLALPAGLVLALRYDRTRSLAAVWVEHALYGTAVFTLGLGYSFYVAA